MSETVLCPGPAPAATAGGLATNGPKFSLQLASKGLLLGSQRRNP